MTLTYLENKFSVWPSSAMHHIVLPMLATLSLRYVLIEQKCDEGRPCFFTYIGSQGVHGYVFKIPDVWSFLFKDIQGHGVSCTHYAILKRQ